MWRMDGRWRERHPEMHLNRAKSWVMKQGLVESMLVRLTGEEEDVGGIIVTG